MTMYDNKETPIRERRPVTIKKKRHSPLNRMRIAWHVRRALLDDRHGTAPFETFRKTISGSFPERGTPGVILAACDDLYYRQFAVSMALSLELQGQEQALHLHLCDPSAETIAHARRLSERLSVVRLTFTVDPCVLAEKLPYRTIYFAASRFLVAPLVQASAGGAIFATDIDSLAMRPVWQDYQEEARKADVLLYRRPEMSRREWKVLASAVGVGAGPDAVRFAEATARSIAAALAIRPRYHVDQIVLHLLSELASKRGAITIGDMPHRFSDFSFEDDAVFWTAKGKTGKASERFAEAQQRMEAAFPDLASFRKNDASPTSNYTVGHEHS